MRLKLGHISKEEFEELKGDITLKREIAPWYKNKFPLGYMDGMDGMDVLLPNDFKDPLEEDVNLTDFKEERTK